MLKRGFTIHLSNKVAYTLIAILVLAIIGVGVYAFGTSNPSSFGHSAGEIEEVDPIFSASALSDGVSWSEIPDRPSGLDSDFPTCTGTRKLTFDGTNLICSNDIDTIHHDHTDTYCTISVRNCQFGSCQRKAVSISCPTSGSVQITECDEDCTGAR